MNAFNPSLNDLKSNLNSMLLHGINSFEDGFEILDVDLEIDEHLTVDVLAKDSKGNPTVVLMADAGEETLINHILDTLCHLRKHRFLLQRIYKEHGFDFSVPPRVLLVSSKFTDGFIEKLDFIVAGDIVPYEYFSLKVDDKDFLTFQRRDIEEGGHIRAFQIDKIIGTTGDTQSSLLNKGLGSSNIADTPNEQQHLSDVKKVAVPTDDKKIKKQEGIQSDRFYHEAKKKILRISNDIVEKIDEPFSRFKINDQILVTLCKDKSGFSIYLGNTTEKPIRISSEDQLNEALNQIFKRYFTVFSSISKT